MARLISQAFQNEKNFKFSQEVKSCIYSIDIVLEVEDISPKPFALEVGSFKAKNFRNEYNNPMNRLRTKILKKHGYIPVFIDT